MYIFVFIVFVFLLPSLCQKVNLFKLIKFYAGVLSEYTRREIKKHIFNWYLILIELPYYKVPFLSSVWQGYYDYMDLQRSWYLTTVSRIDVHFSPPVFNQKDSLFPWGKLSKPLEHWIFSIYFPKNVKISNPLFRVLVHLPVPTHV